MFIAFDQEETGLQAHPLCHAPPRPFKRLKAFLTADLIGRSMANLMDEHVFVLGSERSAQMRKLVEEVKPPAGLTVGRLGRTAERRCGRGTKRLRSVQRPIRAVPVLQHRPAPRLPSTDRHR
jgi:hypothetical protein